MWPLVFFTSALLVYSIPTAEAFSYSFDDIIVVTDAFFSDNLIVHRAEHDVVDILYPLNALNKNLFSNETLYFFALAEFKCGRKIEKGLFVSKNGVVTKLLCGGRVSAAAKDNTREAYFGARDGLYSYNADKNRAEKYGILNDPIISVMKMRGEDTLYVLTEYHILFKLTAGGSRIERITYTPYTEDIVLDSSNNLYYSTPDKKVHIVGSDGVRQVAGLPTYIDYLKIYKAPFFVESAIAVIANDMSHLVFFNGTVGAGHCEYLVKPTAYSLQPLLLQQYGYKKNIYQLNFLNKNNRKNFKGQVKTLVERRSDAINRFCDEFEAYVAF